MHFFHQQKVSRRVEEYQLSIAFTIVVYDFNNYQQIHLWNHQMATDLWPLDRQAPSILYWGCFPLTTKNKTDTISRSSAICPQTFYLFCQTTQSSTLPRLAIEIKGQTFCVCSHAYGSVPLAILVWGSQVSSADSIIDLQQSQISLCCVIFAWVLGES